MSLKELSLGKIRESLYQSENILNDLIQLKNDGKINNDIMYQLISMNNFNKDKIPNLVKTRLDSIYSNNPYYKKNRDKLLSSIPFCICLVDHHFKDFSDFINKEEFYIDIICDMIDTLLDSICQGNKKCSFVYEIFTPVPTSKYYNLDFIHYDNNPERYCVEFLIEDIINSNLSVITNFK